MTEQGVLETESFAGELAILRKIYQHLIADKLPSVYFICGQTGSLDESGLPENIMVAPAAGVDWFRLYKRTDVTMGPEY